MKRKGMKQKCLLLILSVVLALSMTTVLCGCGGNDEAIKALEGKTWYTSGGEDGYNEVYVRVLKFGEDKVATVLDRTIDGNGIHSSSEYQGSYTADDANVTITAEGMEDLVIPFTMEEGAISFDKNVYCTAEEVDEQIQGYWKSGESSLVGSIILLGEHNIRFSDGKVTYEFASRKSGGYDGEYYYYGPYDGTYKIGDGEVVTEADRSTDTYFSFVDGKVRLYHYYHQYEKSDKLPGQNGYKFY